MFTIVKPVTTSNIIPVSQVPERTKRNVQLRETGITSNDRKTDKDEKNISRPQIELVIEDLEYNRSLYDVDLKYSFHQKSGRIIISVVDRDSGELIREIPHEEILDMVSKMEEMAGRIFDKLV